MAKSPPVTAAVSVFVAGRRQAIDRTLAGVKLLPSNATVAMKVLELKRRGDAGAADLARVIATDASLASKVLALANSAAFAPVKPITRLSQAIVQIGLSNLLPLVLGLSFAGIFNKLNLPREDQSVLWKGSLLKAVTARACVRRLVGAFGSAEEREAAGEEAFLAGLFQDVALPVFSAADRSAWPEFLAVLELNDAERAAREPMLYGVDHATIGAACAKMLGLPDLFVKITEAHHGGVPALAGAGAGPLAIAMDAAACLPHRLASLSAKQLQTFTIRLRRTASASTPELTELAKDVTDEYTRLSAMFSEPDDAGASFKEFLQNLGAEVADCLQTSIMSSVSEISGLKEGQRRLGDAVAALEDKTQRAQFDPLTNVLTRPAFLARLVKLLPVSRRHGAACAIGYLDLDDFKQINDTHGHPAGDAALIATAALLTGTLRDNGFAGRMGGDEFVFALVARPEALEAAVATFVSRMANVAFSCEGIALEVTTSIGVVPMGIPAPDADAQAVLKDADQLMYRAKRSGKARGAVGGSEAPAALAGVIPMTGPLSAQNAA